MTQAVRDDGRDIAGRRFIRVMNKGKQYMKRGGGFPPPHFMSPCKSDADSREEVSTKGPRLNPARNFCRLLIPLLATSIAPFVSAESLRFALVAKTLDNPLFVQASEGCATAARAEGDTCMPLGSRGPLHFRRQNEVLEQALDSGLDGLAVSVSNSQWLSDHALQHLGSTPLITFDSDLAPMHRHLSRAYIGVDNLALGRDLGSLAQRLRPQGGTLCILSGWPEEANLDERIAGIRQQLAGVRAPIDRLHGKNGWSEPERCPLYNADTFQTALTQLDTLLETGQIDVIISVGSWLVRQPEEFRQQLAPRLAKLKRMGRRPDLIIVTVGDPSADLQAMLEEGLVQAYVSTPTFELGRQSYRLMKRLAEGKPVPEKTYIDYRIHPPGPDRAAPAADDTPLQLRHAEHEQPGAQHLEPFHGRQNREPCRLLVRLP